MRKDSKDNLETVTPEMLVTATGGVLPKGYDEALAEGEKAAEHTPPRRLLD